MLQIEFPIEFYYAEIRVYLEREGIPIGANDLLIASHGLALNLTVIKANGHWSANVGWVLKRLFYADEKDANTLIAI